MGSSRKWGRPRTGHSRAELARGERVSVIIARQGWVGGGVQGIVGIPFALNGRLPTETYTHYISFTPATNRSGRTVRGRVVGSEALVVNATDVVADDSTVRQGSREEGEQGKDRTEHIWRSDRVGDGAKTLEKLFISFAEIFGENYGAPL